jgi:AcrR family transcriptional regulator
MKSAAREELRESILDATDRLLARHGYRKMTMEDVAHDAGIGKGTTYLYFPSKEELVLGTIDRLVTRLAERLRAIAAGGGSATERLRRMLVERVLFRLDHLHQNSQSMDEMLAVLRPALLARRERYFALEAGIFAAVLGEGATRGEIAAADPEGAAQVLVMATNSLLPYGLSARELGSRARVAENASRIADLLILGLTPPRAAHGRSRAARHRPPSRRKP